jgi:hypothetical protein
VVLAVLLASTTSRTEQAVVAAETPTAQPLLHLVHTRYLLEVVATQQPTARAAHSLVSLAEAAMLPLVLAQVFNAMAAQVELAPPQVELVEKATSLVALAVLGTRPASLVLLSLAAAAVVVPAAELALLAAAMVERKIKLVLLAPRIRVAVVAVAIL